MHVIPCLIPEAVLGTKEPSEKARAAAFELIVAMGRKMSEGGIVKRSLVGGMDEDGTDEGAFLGRGMSFSIFLQNVENSCCNCGRIHDHGRWWVGGCKSAHDQRDCDRNLPPDLRVQR